MSASLFCNFFLFLRPLCGTGVLYSRPPSGLFGYGLYYICWDWGLFMSPYTSLERLTFKNFFAWSYTEFGPLKVGDFFDFWVCGG